MANTPAEITITLWIIGLFFKRFGSLGSILFSSSSGKDTKPPRGKALNEKVISLNFFWIIEGPKPIENPST